MIFIITFFNEDYHDYHTGDKEEHILSISAYKY